MKQLLLKMPNKEPNPHELLDKLYFKIGEVSDISGVPTYVLRFWESEFSQIKPRRTESGQRQYKKSDVELILKIKQLLYNNKFTIQGAKRHLLSEIKKNKIDPLSETIAEIRKELQSIRDLLEKPL